MSDMNRLNGCDLAKTEVNLDKSESARSSL